MVSSAEKYHLLEDRDSTEEPEDYVLKNISDEWCAYKSTQKDTWKDKLGILTATSLLVNTVLLAACLALLVELSRRTEPPSLPTEVSRYARLSRDTSVSWPYNTGFGTDISNHSLLDERWEAIDIDTGLVAIDHDWASEHNLARSQDFPWDRSKGVYSITAFHTVHCLKTLHHLVYSLHHGLPTTSSTEHALHCLDHMRTDAICEADDFLLATGPSRYMNEGPRGQARVCRNWDQLVSWARQHSACYQHLTDDEERFAAEHGEIERYLNCPRDSPYNVKAQKYRLAKGL